MGSVNLSEIEFSLNVYLEGGCGSKEVSQWAYIYIYIKKESDRVVNVLLETSYGEIDKVDIKRSKKI